MTPRTIQRLVLAAALVNSVLYSCALPLWEGFDEVVHYAYVETILVHHQLPMLNQTRVSKELRDSLYLTPLSNEQCESLPGSISFEQWAALSDAQKERRKANLLQLPQSAREQLSEYKNYEAQQAPLAYLLYVPFDLLVGKLSLPARILSLRLCGTVLSCLLLYVGTCRLLRELGAGATFRPAMLATAFASQMLWASVGHVGNDVLAIPLTVWFLSQLAATVNLASPRNLLALAATLGLGLLAKAYFLAFVPIFMALIMVAFVRRVVPGRVAILAVLVATGLAVPWYWRNVALYGSLSGTQQSVAGIGLRQALYALPRIYWLESAAAFSRWSLWTGNYSFLAFSRITLDIEIWLAGAALIVYLVLWRKIRSAEAWLWAAFGCFALSLVYQTCVTWVESRGLARFPEPWYAQGVIICLWALCFVGLSRWPPGGRWIASTLVLVSAWIASMTYVAKLLPYYAGGIKTGMARVVSNWWINDPWQAIDLVTLASARAIGVLLILFLVLLVAATGFAVKTVLTPFQGPANT